MAKLFWDLKHGRSHVRKTSQPEHLCLIEDALAAQEMFLNRKATGLAPDAEYQFLMFVEHHPVYVITRSDHKKLSELGNKANFFRPGMDKLPARLHVLPEDRGGSITYHGPGQLVCYMILCEEELAIQSSRYVTPVIPLIEESIKSFLSSLGVRGYTTNELCEITYPHIREQLISQKIMHVDSTGKSYIKTSAQGIWVIHRDEAKKIASRGLRRVVRACPEQNVKYFIKYGFAINISTDLRYFDYIYPCGEDIKMTSVQAITNAAPPIYQAAQIMAEAFIKTLRELTEKIPVATAMRTEKGIM